LSEGTKGNFQLYLIGWSGRTDPDQNVINHLGCDTPFNWGKYCSEKVMAALTEARTETAPERRKAAYEKALAQIDADKAADLPLSPHIAVCAQHQASWLQTAA
jgi:peptide/nickel transport system substrate-binding protein